MEKETNLEKFGIEPLFRHNPPKLKRKCRHTKRKPKVLKEVSK